jgi:hypothetical protein
VPTVAAGPRADQRASGAPAPAETPAQETELPLHPGERPLPDYELVARRGQGGFGEVGEASGPGCVRVAIKFVPLGA